MQSRLYREECAALLQKVGDFAFLEHEFSLLFCFFGVLVYVSCFLVGDVHYFADCAVVELLFISEFDYFGVLVWCVFRGSCFSLSVFSDLEIFYLAHFCFEVEFVLSSLFALPFFVVCSCFLSHSVVSCDS